VDVEAELGKVGDTGFGGGEGTGEATPDVFTDVEESAEFIAKTGVDALAIAIGNLHGRYVATPKLNIDRLKEIAARNNMPLVLHGGSGTSEEDFKACIHNGISKINVATALQMAVTADVKAYVEDPMANYIDMKGVITEATKKSVMDHIMLFESNGKA
jgi:fructose-bisphosphate aldolase class II